MRRVLLTGLTLCLLASPLTATEPGKSMGEEHFGNKPLNAANFTSWPRVIRVVNDQHRVYHAWVNGDESCCYRGDTTALNALLQEFAKVKSERLELVLRPGPGIAKTFTPGKTVSYDWRLQLYGGIAAHMSKRDQGEHIWATHPVLTIRVADGFDLEGLVIPENISVLQIFDLKRRYLKCLASKDQTVRGWCCGHLSELNKYDTEIMNGIAQRLDDPENWVRLNALGSLATYGSTALVLVDKIKANLTSDDEQLKKQAEKTLSAIQSATEEPNAQVRHDQLLQKISLYCENRK